MESNESSQMVTATFQQVNFDFILWVFINSFRQQVCNDPGAAVSTSYLQAKQDGTFQVVNPYLNSQFNAVQNSQVNSAPQKYNSRQQGETNELNLNVSS